MSNELNTGLLADKNKVSLTENDLYDKVINLKLYVKNKDGTEKDTYVIRSDFELFYPNLMDSVAKNNMTSFVKEKACYIRKCQNKPSIKIQYKRVALNSSIEVDIFVHNFYMLDQAGNIINGFNQASYPLSRVDISMGYFGQFKALFADKLPENPKDLTTTGFATESSPSVGHGITTITMSGVNYTQMDKLPPDAVLHIHGYVGNTLTTKAEPKESPATYDKIAKSQKALTKSLNSEIDSYLERVYFNEITRYYTTKGTLSQKIFSQIDSNKDADTGMMSESDAKKYGIKVYLSKGVQNYSKEKEAEFKKDASGSLIEPAITIPFAFTAESKMNMIESALGLKGFAHSYLETLDCFIVFLKDELEDIATALDGTKLADAYKSTTLTKTWQNKIPAVYNITIDEKCTIVCPFFCFINPFEKVEFATRYNLGGLVNYYVNSANDNKAEFYVLWINISFATVEDVNECMIVCTNIKKKE